MADTCRFYSYEGGFFGSGDTCSIRGTKERVASGFYERYCKHDYNRRDCPLYKKYGPYESSGCFITTVTCEILGCQDDSKVMNDLRKFRDEVLQNDRKKYQEILDDYDFIGSKLANCIRNDDDKEIMAKGLYENALVPIANLVNEREYDKAVEVYYIMTLMLINYYKKKHEYNEMKDKGYELDHSCPKLDGHGRRLVK